MIRADGVIPSFGEMNMLFGHRALENVQTHVPLPNDRNYFGAKVVFRNIGNYNDVRKYMKQHNNMVDGFWRLYAK